MRDGERKKKAWARSLASYPGPATKKSARSAKELLGQKSARVCLHSGRTGDPPGDCEGAKGDSIDWARWNKSHYHYGQKVMRRRAALRPAWLQRLPKLRVGGRRTFIMKEQQQIRVGADFFTRAVFNNAFIILELQEQCLWVFIHTVSTLQQYCWGWQPVR